MSLSKKVFITPSVFSAFIDRGHPKHEQVSAFFRYFAQEEYQLFTDNTTLITTYTQIYTDISPSLAKDFLRTIPFSSINVLYAEENDTKAALKALVTYKSTDLTFPEALIAVLAVKQRISIVCTLNYLHPLFALELFYLPI